MNSPCFPCSNPCVPYYCSQSNRLGRLNDKLDIINSKIDKEKQMKEMFIHKKIDNVSDHLNNCINYANSKFSDIKESLLNIQSLFEQIQKKEKENSDERNNLMETIEKKFDIRLEQERQNRILCEKKLNSLIDQKFLEMKIKLSENSKERFEGIENLKLLMDRELPILKQTVLDEIKERKNNDENIINNINKNKNELFDKIANEKKERENIQQNYLDSIKKDLNNFKENLRKEREKRKETENKLVGLLELTCNNINLKQNANEEVY
jgi:hypothetical protein